MATEAYDPNGGKPRPGEVSPLEGMIGPQGMMVCNMVFAVMTLKMCQTLGMEMSRTLGGPLLSSRGFSGPGEGATAPGFAQTLGNSISGGMSPAIPSFPSFTPKMGL